MPVTEPGAMPVVELQTWSIKGPTDEGRGDPWTARRGNVTVFGDSKRELRRNLYARVSSVCQTQWVRVRDSWTVMAADLPVGPDDGRGPSRRT